MTRKQFKLCFNFKGRVLNVNTDRTQTGMVFFSAKSIGQIPFLFTYLNTSYGTNKIATLVR